MKKFLYVLFALLCIGFTIFILLRPSVPVSKRFADVLDDCMEKFENYDELFEQYVKENSSAYEELNDKLLSISEDISSVEEDLTCLYSYFEDDAVSRSEAHESFSHLDSVLSKFY